jgi:predicted MFS family arabinose efflux permease
MATTEATPGEPADRPDRPGLASALVAFKYRNFSLFWTGALLSSTGTWVQNVTIPVVVFELTGSVAWLGFMGALQFGPIVVMGPIGGAISDRFPRRTVLIVTQAAQAAVALMLWAAWVTGHRSMTVIVVLVILSGLIAGIYVPSWQAFVSELVPREVLLNAVTLNSAQFNAARLFGPAIGGLVLGFLGVSWAFLINAISFVAVIVALVLIRVPPLVKTTSAGVRGIATGFVESMRYSRARPGIMACFILVVSLGALGSPMVQFFTVFAREVFHVGDAAYGFLGASLGLGSVLIAPVLAGTGSAVRRSRIVEIAVVAYGLAVVSFGLAPAYVFGLGALLVAGAGYLALAATFNATIQMQVDEAMRGKVIALYLMLLTLALPVGAFVQGLVGEALGPQVAVTGAGILFLAVGAWVRFRTDLLAAIDGEPSPSPSPAQAHTVVADPG